MDFQFTLALPFRLKLPDAAYAAVLRQDQFVVQTENAESLVRRGELRLAIVDMNAALDILVENRGIEILQADGSTVEAATGMVEALTTHQVMNQILIPNIREQNITHDPRWADWTGIFKLLRNRVVHDGYEPSVGEATASLTAIRALMGFVRDFTAKKKASDH